MASMADFFEDHRAVNNWREDAWSLIFKCQHLDWLILTKRPENIFKMLPDDWGLSVDKFQHVWHGTSIEDQRTADLRIPHLMNVKHLFRWESERHKDPRPLTLARPKVWFVSYEPALGPVNLSQYLEKGMVDWVISGGESGAEIRPDKTEWHEQVARQCQKSGAAYFYKQSAALRPGFIHPDLRHLPREFPSNQPRPTKMQLQLLKKVEEGLVQFNAPALGRWAWRAPPGSETHIPGYEKALDEEAFRILLANKWIQLAEDFVERGFFFSSMKAELTEAGKHLIGGLNG